MPALSIPDRIVWAAEVLSLSPTDQVLEIGCGSGQAVPLISGQLRRRRLVAIDRSAKMIGLARKRNRALAAAGNVQFETAALADADLGRRKFSKVFAVNVNLFWIDPALELPIVRRLLKPAGALYLFYEPPSAAQLKSIAVKLAHHLDRAGFALDKTILGGGSQKSRLCVIARPSGSVQ